MKEQVRQFVIYGDFSNITFDEIASKNLKFNDLILGAAMDVPTDPNFVQVQLIPAQNSEAIRPVFRDSENKKNLFIGATRIHYQENNVTIETYDDFIRDSLQFLSHLLEACDITKVNRMASNGAFVGFSDDKASQVFDSCLNRQLFDRNSNDWSLRINETAVVEELKCEVNQILSVVRGNPVFDIEKKSVGPMALEYDYNTTVIENQIFSIDKFSLFSDGAKKFRQRVMSL